MPKNFRTAFPAALLALVAGGAEAGWTQVADNAEVGVTMYIDRTTIRKTGDNAEMWSMSDYQVPRAQSGKKFLSSKTRYEYDCTGRRWRQLYFTWHSANMGQGDLVLADDGKPTAWRDVTPGSIAETYWRAACAKR